MRESFSSLRQIEHHNNDTIRLYDNTQADDYPAHWNNAFEIIMPVENTYTVCISDTFYEIYQDEVLIIPAGSVHEIFAPECGRRFILMADQSLFYTVEGLAACSTASIPACTCATTGTKRCSLRYAAASRMRSPSSPHRITSAAPPRACTSPSRP